MSTAIAITLAVWQAAAALWLFGTLLWAGSARSPSRASAIPA